MERVKLGDTFHAWTVIAGPLMKGKGLKYWTCQCTCGTQKEIQQYSLLNGRTHSCGCQKVFSEETRKLLSELRKQRPAPRAKGFTQTEETKAKISQGAKQRWDQRKAQP